MVSLCIRVDPEVDTNVCFATSASFPLPFPAETEILPSCQLNSQLMTTSYFASTSSVLRILQVLHPAQRRRV